MQQYVQENDIRPPQDSKRGGGCRLSLWGGFFSPIGKGLQGGTLHSTSVQTWWLWGTASC